MLSKKRKTTQEIMDLAFHEVAEKYDTDIYLVIEIIK